MKVNGNLPCAPFVDAVIDASKGVKNPSVKLVTCKIANSLLERVKYIANAEVPRFFCVNSEDESVKVNLKIKHVAVMIAGDFDKFRSWRDAYAWIIHVGEVVAPDECKALGFEKLLMMAFDCVHDLQKGWDPDFVAVANGYASIEEANAEAVEGAKK